MRHRNNDAPSCALVSDERIRNVLRSCIRRAIHIERTHTREELAEEARINVSQIDAVMSRDKSKHRRVAAEDMLSLAFVLGGPTVNALVKLLGYGGATPLDEPASVSAADLVAESLHDLSVIAADAIDGHIDQASSRSAADDLIERLTPFSSAGHAE